MYISRHRLGIARNCVAAGGIIAYPTEAVYGLGCNPFDETAIERLLDLKQRSPDKGLLVIGASSAQLQRLIRGDWPAQTLASWPGPQTWIVDAAPGLPPLLTGARDSIALRVTAHPLAAALCRACGPLVSTSANRSDYRPARSALQVRRRCPGVDLLIPGPLGGLPRPTPIRDARSGHTLRD